MHRCYNFTIDYCVHDNVNDKKHQPTTIFSLAEELSFCLLGLMICKITACTCVDKEHVGCITFGTAQFYNSEIRL